MGLYGTKSGRGAFAVRGLVVECDDETMQLIDVLVPVKAMLRAVISDGLARADRDKGKPDPEQEF